MDKLDGVIVTWLVSAISSSCYFLVFSLGYSIIFGFQGIVNFAQGAFYMIGAYTGLMIFLSTQNYGFALLGGFFSVFLLAILAERSLVSRCYGKDPLYSFWVTLGLSMAMGGFARFIFGSVPRGFGMPSFIAGSLVFGEIYVQTYRVFQISLSILIVIAMYFLLFKTRIGNVIRAGAFKISAVEALGINVRKYFSLCFGLGCGLAAIDAVMFAPIFYVAINSGEMVLLYSFAAVIIGGLGSFRGTIIGSFVVGFILTLGVAIMGYYSQLLLFVIMVAVLLVRPRGLLGKTGVLD